MNQTSKQSFQFFIAGIIQGSHHDFAIHNQDYRSVIKEILQTAIPGSQVFCPAENHQNSTAYDDAQAHLVFFDHIEKVKSCHCLIVFLPEASLGTAIEMWEAYHHSKVILTISPMKTNWVVRLLSHELFSSMEKFQKYVDRGELAKYLKETFVESSTA